MTFVETAAKHEDATRPDKACRSSPRLASGVRPSWMLVGARRSWPSR